MARIVCQQNNATLPEATGINTSVDKCIINNLERLAMAREQDLQFWLNSSSRHWAIDFQDRSRSMEMTGTPNVTYVACEKGKISIY